MSLLILCLALHACAPDPVQWIAIGDSITYLNEHPDESDNRITKGYMTRVTETLPHIKYINKGFNGWTAGDIAREIDSIDLTPVGMYTVFLGTNDWWRGRPIGTLDDFTNNSGNHTFYGSYRIILDKLRSLNAASRIILITPMQRVDFVYWRNMKNNAYGSYREKDGQTLAAFADAVRNIGEMEKLEVIDLYNESGMTHDNLVKFKRLKDPETGNYREYRYPDFIHVPFNPDTDEYPYPPEAADMTYDGLHPSDRGYEVIAGMLLEKLR